MRRTTICRSERAALLALVAGLLGGGLAPGASLAQATESTSVTGPPTPGDTVHAVPAPDTVAADTIAMFDTATVVEALPAEPTEGYQTLFDRRRTATQEVREVLRAYVNQPYRPLRRGEFYAAGFLTEQQRLPYGRVLGNTSVPAIPRLTNRSTATTFDQISVQPPRSASYHVGDSLLIVRIDRDIAGWGGVVVPLGVARVTELQRRQVLADVIMQFGRIHGGHPGLPLEPVQDPGEVR